MVWGPVQSGNQSRGLTWCSGPDKTRRYLGFGCSYIRSAIPRRGVVSCGNLISFEMIAFLSICDAFLWKFLLREFMQKEFWEKTKTFRFYDFSWILQGKQ